MEDEYVGVASNSYQLVQQHLHTAPTAFVTAICRQFVEVHWISIMAVLKRDRQTDNDTLLPSTRSLWSGSAYRLLFLTFQVSIFKAVLYFKYKEWKWCAI